jgi:protein ImuB
MRRIVSLWLPQFAIERLIRDRPRQDMIPTSQPLVLVQAGAHGLRLAACSAAARARGLKTGERLADARARVPDLVSRLHEPDKDAAVLLKLMRWSERWSPFIAPDPPDGLVLDVTGIAHLFGGEAALLADMAAKFRRLGFTVNLALAGTAAAAWALARFSPVNPHSTLGPTSPFLGEVRRASRKLRPPPSPSSPPARRPRARDPAGRSVGARWETCQTLRRLGLKRIGQLHDLPRASLARRFRERSAKLAHGEARPGLGACRGADCPARALRPCLRCARPSSSRW